MLRITVLVFLFAVSTLILSSITPPDLTRWAFFLVAISTFFQIGYELGLRAPTNAGSLARYNDPFSVRMKKFFINSFSIGFSKRTSELDSRGFSSGSGSENNQESK